MSATSLHVRELAVNEVQLAAAEVVSFEEFGQHVLPAMARMLQSSGRHLYRSDHDCPLVGLAGDGFGAMAPEYVTRYLREDPLQVAAYRENSWILRLARTPEWTAYVKRPVHDFFSREGFEFLLHIRLAEGEHFEPGMMGLVVTRSPRQQDFSDDDTMAVARVLPALRAAARRCSRTLAACRAKGALEALLDEDGKLALDLRGRLLWMSPRAARWLGDEVGMSRGLPAALEEAAARLGAMMGGEAPSSPPRLAVALCGAEGVALRAHLRIGRSGGGEPFVLVELEAAGDEAAAFAATERFALTRAEAEVLALLAMGLRDREIAERTATSQHTVRTHVGRILSKLGVRSRVEAALVARGPGPGRGRVAQAEK
jgi:DNA-binding CsgD family transcriptional regulator